MIKAELFKTDDEYFDCNNEKCQHSLNYHYYHEDDKAFYLKQNISCLSIEIDSYTVSLTYCPDCMKIIYQQFKSVLDPKLRPFL